MEITHQESKNQYSTPALNIYKKIKSLLVVMLIIGLVTSNIATLITDAFHNRIYGAISRLVDALPNFQAKNKILQNSPTSQRRVYVRKATAKLQTEKNTLARKNQILNRNNGALYKANSKLTSEHNALIKNNANLMQRHSNLKNSYTNLFRQHAIVQQSNKALHETSRQRAVKVQAFSKRMSNRSVTFAARNIASLPAEFIPMFGTGVILAVTSADIYALCESMKDINNLNQNFGLAHENESESKICGIKIPDKDSVWGEMKTSTQNSFAKAKEYVDW